MTENAVKSRLASGGYALGANVGFVRTPALMRMIAAAGYDFVVIDMEHSAFSMETVGDMCQMARASGLVPLVRPYSHDPSVGNRIQDLGAMGLMHFDVSSRAQVDTFLRWMRYPPAGDRAAFSNVIAEYKAGQGKEGNQFLNDQTMLVIQVESPEAVEAIDEIVHGGGVDVVEIGRADLSQSYGVPGQRRHPQVLAAVDKIVAAGKAWNVAVGAGCDSREDAEDLIGRGVRYLMGPGSDFGILNRGYKDGNSMLRGLIEARSATRDGKAAGVGHGDAQGRT